MSTFTEPLIVSPLPGGRRWRLVGHFTYAVGSEHSGAYIVVPSGFETDFASVPRMFWSIIPPWGKYGKAAIVHDYLYQTLSATSIKTGIRYTRKDADDIFLEAMGVLGVPTWKKYLMYWAVRLFGWAAFR